MHRATITTSPVDLGSGRARALIIVVEGPRAMVDQLLSVAQNQGVGRSLEQSRADRIAALTAPAGARRI